MTTMSDISNVSANKKVDEKLFDCLPHSVMSEIVRLSQQLAMVGIEFDQSAGQLPLEDNKNVRKCLLKAFMAIGNQEMKTTRDRLKKECQQAERAVACLKDYQFRLTYFNNSTINDCNGNKTFATEHDLGGDFSRIAQLIGLGETPLRSDNFAKLKLVNQRLKQQIQKIKAEIGLPSDVQPNLEAVERKIAVYRKHRETLMNNNLWDDDSF